MKLFILVSTFFLYSFLSLGQRVYAPVEYNPEQAEHYMRNSTLRLMAVGDTLTLPFYDDFTQSTVAPDINKWETNGGTFINSRNPTNPPNFNVATFDGIKENGTPYNAINTNAKGATDKLTSRPIDLSIANLADPAYLRFYWQAGGMIENPNPEDSLIVQFKDAGGVWHWAWGIKGVGSGTEFNHAIIPIADAAKYYFKGFQFRFQSYGRLSGFYDGWNVDYVHLDTGRLAKENWFPDFSFTALPTSFLKNYSAMPIHQYMANINEETADTVSVALTNLYHSQRSYNVYAGKSKLIDITNNKVLDTTMDQSALISMKSVVTPKSTYFKSDTLLYYIPSPTAEITTNIPKVLKYTFTVKDSSADSHVGDYYQFDVSNSADSVQSRIDFTSNDSVSGYTNLTDYYAYDDGSAEYGLGISNDATGKIALKYQLNVFPDTLTHIDIYFPRIGLDRSLESIYLSIWTNINLGSSGETILYRENVMVKHSSSHNQFHRYQLQTPVEITSPVIYVGFQHTSINTIFAGIDKNNDHMDKIYYNVQDTWNQEDHEPGSLMIRPVFQKAPIVSGLPKPGHTSKELECEVFPNPSNGQISIAGKISIMHLYDLSGRLLLTKEFDGHTEDIKLVDLSFLPNGFYIMHLQNGEFKAVKKIILNQ